MSSSRIIIILIVFMIINYSNSIGQDSRIELQNDVNIELLGRCLIYSFTYQRLVNPALGLELGMCVLGGSGSSIETFSGGFRIYFSQKNATPCLSGGIVVIASPSNSGPFSDDQHSDAYGYIGPGFEYRSPNGFVLRGTVYFLIRNGFFVWPGAQVGIAF
jgi:hypothetical protein